MTALASLVLVVGLIVGATLLLFGAPVADDLLGFGAALGAGRRPAFPRFEALFRLRNAWARERLGADRAPDFGPTLAVASLASAVLAVASTPAALAVPLLGGLAGIVLLALCRTVSALFALGAAVEAGPATHPTTLRTLPIAVFGLPALLFAAAPLAIDGGSTRIGTAFAGLGAGAAAPRLLAAGALALLLAAEDPAGRGDGSSFIGAGPVGVVLAIARQLRRVVLLGLLAAYLPPTPPTGLADGVVPLLFAAPVLAIKVALGAVALGMTRPFRVAVPPERLLGGATVLASLGAVLAVVGQTLE